MKKINIPRLKIDHEWSFSDLTREDTGQFTHLYHKYPAKFIPHVAAKLINNYSNVQDLILDPFGGCGTTAVVAKQYKRKSFSIDINPVAVLIARAKVKAIEPRKLRNFYKEFLDRITRGKKENSSGCSYKHPRLKYWFRKKEYGNLNKIYSLIRSVKDYSIKQFLACGFSNILKNCSTWYSKSIKPMRDKNKRTPDVFSVFKKHLDFMVQKNNEFYEELIKKDCLTTPAIIKRGDARNIPLRSNSVDLIVTSPPYVSSYEYADIHQLSAFWFGYTNDLAKFRNSFIGTSSKKGKNEEVNSKTAEAIINRLKKIDRGLSNVVRNYYADLHKSFCEVKRVLKKGKKICLIIGNTEYKGVKIDNLNVSFEQLRNLEFRKHKIIKRKISSKIFTPYRNRTNGKFTSSKDKNKKRVYQHEYILVMEKCN